MQNVEFKAELRDLALARIVAGSIGALSIETMTQTDTYYRVPDARLKKREAPGRPTEWIFYHRPARTRPKLSQFTIYSDQQAKERFGISPLPVWLTVKKSRELWFFNGARVHFDTVKNLGTFIEFEALVCPERKLAACHALLDELRKAFAPAMGEAIACGYADLLEKETAETAPKPN